jgi:hypothetical protein
MMEQSLHLHARRLLELELCRRRGVLARLPADRRALVEELVTHAVAASVDAVLECARREEAVAAALESVYGGRSVPTPVPVGAD